MCLIPYETSKWRYNFIDFVHRNIYQEGVDQITQWNVQYNTNKPLNFPMSALVIYIYLELYNLMEHIYIFTGYFLYNRSEKMIGDITKKHEYDVQTYGKVENLGSHLI